MLTAEQRRSGLILLVVFGLVSIFSVGWFVVVGVPRHHQPLVVCTDDAKICPDGTAVGRSGPNCEFAKCPDVNLNTNGAIPDGSNTFHNTTLKYHLTLPDGWFVRSADGGVRVDPASATTDTRNMFSPSSSSNDSDPSLIVQGTSIDTYDAYPQTVAQWRSLRAVYDIIPKESPITVGNATGVLEQSETDITGRPTTILVTRGKIFYQIQVGGLKNAETQAILKSFVFDEPAKAATAKIPFTKVQELNNKKQDFGNTDVQAVSIMGDKVLIGGQALLGVYSLTNGTFTDLSKKLPQDDRARFRTVTAISNNGKYWLAITSGSEGQQLWKVSGTTVTEKFLGPNKTPSLVPGRISAIDWSGSEWLIGDWVGHLYSFDGETATDLTSDVDAILSPTRDNNITGIVADGKNWRLLIRSSVYTYVGHTLTLVPVPESSLVNSMGYHNGEWVYVNRDHRIFLGHGSSVTDSLQTLPSYAIQDLVWTGTAWFNGTNFFDGASLSAPAGVSLLGTGQGAVVDASDHYAVFAGRDGVVSVLTF